MRKEYDKKNINFYIAVFCDNLKELLDLIV